ncbi:MAG: hypothetical protein ACHQ4H_16160 [Ktedonobacterales bacterium]
MDHFAFDAHHPCRERMVAHSAQFVCYACGAPAVPRQWSTAPFAHFSDSSGCAGCGRPICDERHTRLREDRVEIVRESLRSQRYYVTRRYCDGCARWRWLGGRRGARRYGTLIVAAAATAAAVALHFH